MRLVMRALVLVMFVTGFFTCGCGGKLVKADAELQQCQKMVAGMEGRVRELEIRSNFFETAFNLLERRAGQCTGDGLTGLEKAECFNSVISNTVNALKDKGTAGTPTTTNAVSASKPATLPLP